MDAIRGDIEKLVSKELEAANTKFPMFRSEHEGAAVIFEELQEAQEFLADTDMNFRGLWGCIRQNGTESKNLASDIKSSSIGLAVEAIQIAAMAQKFEDSFKRN